MPSSKRFKILLCTILTNHLIAGVILWKTIFLLPVSLLLLVCIRMLDIRLEELESDHYQKVKELVDAENLTRKYVTKLTDQVKIISKKLNQHENSIGKIDRRLHRHDGSKFQVDNGRSQVSELPLG